MVEKIWRAFKKMIGDAVHNIFLKYIEHVILAFLLVAALIVYSFRNYIELIIFTRVPIWSIIIGAVILYVSLLTHSFFKSKRVHKRDKYGVEWHVNISKGKVKSIKGPFCPSCKFEMSDDSPSYCQMCNTNYPELTISNGEIARKTVQKIIETEFREGKLLSPNWSINYPYSSFKIINNSASTAKNVSLRLDLKINGETEVIGTYGIGDIDPDGVGIIDNSDMMEDAHTVLDAMQFIWMNTISFDGIETVNERGNIEYIAESISAIRLLKQFKCKLGLNISYSLKGMNKTELYNYVLEFEHLMPGIYHDYEDNCSFDFHRID